MKWFLLVVCVLFLNVYLGRPSMAEGSGAIEWTCDASLARHYGQKGVTLYKQRSYSDSVAAFSASIAAIKKCNEYTLNPVWLYWIHTEEALADVAVGDYFDANAIIVTAEGWKSRVPASLSSDDAASVKSTDKNMAFIKNAIAAYRARPVAPPPPAENYLRNFSDCDTDSIESVSDDGAVITTSSGVSYEVDDVDQVTSEVWLGSDDIIVCNKGDHYEIYDKDQSDEHVSAHSI